MVDYSTWQRTNEIPVTEVKLDKYNPRMPENSESLTQEDILNLMVDDYKIIELAESFATKGLMPLDNMVVTYEEGIPVVLEGNRRVAALKLLINPAMAPIKERQRFEALSAKIDVKMIMYPNFTIAPNRDAASPLILDTHTVATEIPWSSIMQAEFHRDILRKRGLDYPTKDVLEEFNLKEKDITDSILRLDIYEKACSFSYPSASIEKKVKDKLGFEITTLERIVNPSISQKRFKYKINNGKLTIIDEELFNSFLKSVVIHMYEPIEGLQRITSRSANKTEQIEKYLRAIKREIDSEKLDSEGQGNQTNQTSSNDGVSGQNSSPADDRNDGYSIEDVAFPPSVPKRQPKRRTVHSNELKFEYNSPANQRIYDELGRITVKDAPSCVTIAIRVLLERTIKSYLKRMKKKTVPLTVEGKKVKVPLADAKFGDILDWITSEDSDVFLDPEVKRNLKKFKRADNSNLLSLSMLNAVIHEQFQVIYKDGVFAIWDNLAPVLEYFMNRPETNAESMAIQN